MTSKISQALTYQVSHRTLPFFEVE